MSQCSFPLKGTRVTFWLPRLYRAGYPVGKDAPVSVVLDYKTARELVVTSATEPRLPAVRRFAKAAKAEVPPLPSSLAAHASTEPWSQVPPLPSQE